MNTRAMLIRARYRLRTGISHIPAIYLPLVDMRRRDEEGATVVTRTTDLVVEAFPRSGNTFTVAALRSCQSQRLEIAHHTHAPAQVIRAVRWYRPTLLIVRQPRDAVLSFVLRHPEVDIGLGLSSWIRFYEKLLPCRDKLVVATFDQVTTDLGAVMDAVNSRFHTGLPRFDHCPKNVDACFQKIEQRYRRRFGDGSVNESGVARPSDVRKASKSELDASWNASPLAAQRVRASSLYDRYAEEAASWRSR